MTTDGAAALDGASVRRARAALVAAGSDARVLELAATARTAQDAAETLGVEVGSIAKSLVFLVGGQAVVALVAGDRQCDAAALPAVLGLEGRTERADADAVRASTGFAIGGVAPLGHPASPPTAIDASLVRFATIHAAAGHPCYVFATTLDELARLTGGIVSARPSRRRPARRREPCGDAVGSAWVGRGPSGPAQSGLGRDPQYGDRLSSRRTGVPVLLKPFEPAELERMLVARLPPDRPSRHGN